MRPKTTAAPSAGPWRRRLRYILLVAAAVILVGAFFSVLESDVAPEYLTTAAVPTEEDDPVDAPGTFSLTLQGRRWTVLDWRDSIRNKSYLAGRRSLPLNLSTHVLPTPFRFALGARAWAEPSFREIFTLVEPRGSAARRSPPPPPLLDGRLHNASMMQLCNGIAQGSPEVFPWKTGCGGGRSIRLIASQAIDYDLLAAGTGADGLFRGAPFAMPANHSLSVVTIENGFASPWTKGLQDYWAQNEVYTSGGALLNAWPHPRWWNRSDVLPNVTIRAWRVFDELAVIGGTCWGGSIGHTVHESLGRIIFLDAVLPARIPLVVKVGDNSRIFDLATRFGAFRGRQLIGDFHDPVAAKQLYFVHSRTLDEPLYSSILPSYYGQIHAGIAFLADWWRRHFHNRAVESGETKRRDRPSNGVALILRHAKGERGWKNEEEVVRGITDHFNCPELESRANPRCRPVHVLQGIGYVGKDKPQLPMNLELLGDELYDACILIASHGAAMNNMVLSFRPGCVVVEIMNVDGEHAMFYSFARAMGLQHYTVYAKAGGHSYPITPDVQELIDIIEENLEPTRNIGWYGARDTLTPPLL